MEAFHGAKLWLTQADRILVYLRDDRPGLPFAAHWDLPGGGREGDESPLSCALREMAEEFGLQLDPGSLTGRPFVSHADPRMMSWLFAGPISTYQIAAIRFGDEGQCWRMMPVTEYLAHPRAIPHFCRWIAAMGAG